MKKYKVRFACGKYVDRFYLANDLGVLAALRFRCSGVATVYRRDGVLAANSTVMREKGTDNWMLTRRTLQQVHDFTYYSDT